MEGFEARELWISWWTGGSASQVPDPGQQVRARTAVDGRGPADDVGAPAEQREDLPVPVGAGHGGRRRRAIRGPRPVSEPPRAWLGRRHAPDFAGRPAGMPARCPVHRPMFREAGPVDATGFRRCRPPRGRGGRWRDPAGRGSPRGGETPPRRRPGCRRSSGSARPARSIGRRIATNPRAERESGDRRGDRRSRRRRRRQCPGEIAHPSRAVVSRRPLVAERLRGRVAVEPFAGPVEPATDPDVVVRAGQVPDDEGEKVKPGGDRVRGGAAAGNVAPRTGLGDAEEAGQQVHAQDALQDAPFVRGGRGLVEGLVDLLQKRGKPGGIGARHPVKFRQEAAADAGFGHARFEPLNRGLVQAGDGAREQAHRVGAR